MAYNQKDTRSTHIDLQIKASDWLESHNILKYYLLPIFFCHLGIEIRELKEAFILDGVNTYEEYFGLQRKIYK